jgi:hypothetical protein
MSAPAAFVGGAACKLPELLAAKPLEIDAFERQFFNHMILELDHYFVRRGRTMNGKDRDPLNEVRMLSDGIMENEGRMGASKTISLQAGNLDPKIHGRRRNAAERG